VTKNEFLDRYIQGGPGNWFFQIDLLIEDGYFYRKQDARNALLNRIITLFDDNQAFFHQTKKFKKA
jgi:hypothetical protein